MATTFPTGSALNLKVARAGVTVEAERSTYMGLLAGTGDGAAFKILDRPGSGRGDTVEVRFQAIDDTDDLFGEAATIVGNEPADVYYTDTVKLNYGSIPGGIVNTVMDQERVPLNIKKGVLRSIGGKWRQRFEKVILAQLAGDVVASAAGGSWGVPNEYTGMNAVTSHSTVGVDAGHIIRAGAEATDTAVAADSTNIMDVDLIREAVTRASSHAYSNQRFAFAPCDTPWGKLYVCVMFHTGWQQLMTYSATNEFTMIEQAKIEGGLDPSVSAFISGPGAIYDRTLILTSDFIPFGITAGAYDDTAGAAARRAVFFGAGAGNFLFGNGYTEGNHLGFTESVTHRRYSAQADSVFGFKVTEVSELSNQRWASFVITHFSAV